MPSAGEETVRAGSARADKSKTAKRFEAVWPRLRPGFFCCGLTADARRRSHGRRDRAPKTPTLLDVLWVRGRLKLQNQERSLPRVLDSNPASYNVTDTRIVGGGIMSKRNLVIERQCGGSGSSPKAGRRVLPEAASSH